MMRDFRTMCPKLNIRLGILKIKYAKLGQMHAKTEIVISKDNWKFKVPVRCLEITLNF